MDQVSQIHISKHRSVVLIVITAGKDCAKKGNATATPNAHEEIKEDKDDDRFNDAFQNNLRGAFM